ncbi:MAG: hypothetical protein HQL46_12120 [Gammaproteobacteria bacterium]|nr:hypothetical protein [Gammaproteobacteria bacterium]
MFSQLIMFMGCAPAIVFEPTGNDAQDANLVAIRVSTNYQQAKFYPGKLPFKFRCVRCYENLGKTSQEVDIQSISCAQCGHKYLPEQQNWRQKAAYSSLFIEVMGIFESEALPADKLLSGLQKLSGLKWQYFYADQSSWKI